MSATATPRIDAHQHFWQRARGDYDWLSDANADLAPLLRDFMPADLAPTLARHGIGQTVLVQAAATTAETEVLHVTHLRNICLGYGIEHQCRVVIIADYLSDDELLRKLGLTDV